VTKAFDESINDITGTLMNSGYSRRLEFEADGCAVDILRKAGYHPGALVSMLENMQANWVATRMDFAATHPPPGDRILQLKRRGLAASQETSAARQKRFDAMLQSL